jgi:hypothetical protein
MQTPKGRGAQLLLILDLGTRIGWVVSVAFRPSFTPGNGLPVPIGYEAGWASEPVWVQRLQENCPAKAGDRTLVVESVLRHHTYWATPARFEQVVSRFLNAAGANPMFLTLVVVLGAVMVRLFAIGPKVRDFRHGRGRWILKGDKNPKHAFLRMGSKAIGLML